MILKKIHSFRNAFRGLAIAWNEESNFRLQLVLAVAALLGAWYFNVTTSEWTIVIILTGLVLTAELINTALEELCDKFSSDPDPHIAKIKDLAAGAVFLASTIALIVGCIIFAPHLLELFS